MPRLLPKRQRKRPEPKQRSKKKEESGPGQALNFETGTHFALCFIFSLFALLLKITYRSLAMIQFKDSFDIQFQVASKVPVQFACPHIKPGGVCEGSSQYGASFGAKMKDIVPLHKTWPFPDDTTC